MGQFLKTLGAKVNKLDGPGDIYISDGLTLPEVKIMGQQQDRGHGLAARCPLRRSAPAVGLALVTMVVVANGPGVLAQALPQMPQTRLAQAPPEVEPLTLPGILDNTSQVLPDGTYVNLHSFDGVAGKTVLIDLTSDEFDAYLWLLDPKNAVVAQDDNGGEGTNERLVLTLSATGTYRIGANTYSTGATGRYQLSVRPGSAAELAQAERLAEATRLHQQGLEAYQAGRYGEAEAYYGRSLAIREQALPETHPDIATSLNNLAWLYQAQGNSSQSLAFFQRGLAIEEANLALNLAIGSEARKRDYIATLSGSTYSTLSFHLQAASTDPEAARLALTTVLRRKGRVLDAVTDTQQQLRQNLSPELLPLLDAYAAVQTQLAAQLYGGLGNQDPAVYRDQINALRQESERLENELSRRSAEFRVETTPVEIAAVQALIPADAALVELVQYRPFDPAASQSERWGNPRYAAYILHASGDPQWVDLGEAAPIDEAAFALINATRSPSSGTQARAAARALDEQLMAPIRPLLGEATHLLLSPDSQLNLIPFAALLDDQDRYLVETYTLTHLTTGRDLLRLQNPAPSRQPPVILANPNYDNADDAGVALVANASTSPRPRGEGPGVRAADQRSGDITDLRFGPLPGTQLEVEAIAPRLTNPILLTEANATENALKQVQSPSILHIATHGFFLEDVEFVPPIDSRGEFNIVSAAPGSLVPPTNRPTSTETRCCALG
jgi:CHAT domain-containing protein